MQMNTPLALSSAQMLTVTEVAARLPRHLRGQFLQTVAGLFSNVVVGDASVHRAAHRAMQMVKISAWQNQRRGMTVDGTGDVPTPRAALFAVDEVSNRTRPLRSMMANEFTIALQSQFIDELGPSAPASKRGAAWAQNGYAI
jgi:hypothetical protein